MSKYIKVDDLQRYCDNQKDHSITPNEFQRMTQYDFEWHTSKPTDCKTCKHSFIVEGKNFGCDSQMCKYESLTNPWHTGTPTEEGWYLLAFTEDGRRLYDANRLKNGIWEYCLIGDILKWQKIKEN